MIYENPLQNNDTITDNKTYFKLDINLTYIAATLNLDFTNNLYAIVKLRKGQEGLKVKLKDIKIYSDKMFNGRVSGTNLKDIFYYIHFDGQQKSMDKLKDDLNQSEFFLGKSTYYLKFILTEKPTDSLDHLITFDFLYNDGTTQSTATNQIHWK